MWEVLFKAWSLRISVTISVTLILLKKRRFLFYNLNLQVNRFAFSLIREHFFHNLDYFVRVKYTISFLKDSIFYLFQIKKVINETKH